MTNRSILDLWELTEHELTQIVDENPSLRGFMLGYVGEYKLRKFLLASPRIGVVQKPDDHARGTRSKNDLTLEYRGRSITFEVKSLQTNSIQFLPDLDQYRAAVQVDASDRRPVILSDGSSLETTCLLRGQFDILAVNLFQLRQTWVFAFALNQALPSSNSRKYTEFQRSQLLATTVRITWPVEPPFVLDPFALMDTLIQADAPPI